MSTESRSDHRSLYLVLAGVLLLLAVLYGVAYAYAGSGVPRNTRVMGVEVGGLPRATALAQLQDRLDERVSAPIRVVAGETEQPVDPRQAGLGVDWDATLDAAGGRSANPVDLARALLAFRDLDPVVTVDEARLDAAVARVATQVDRRPVEGALRFEADRVVVTEAADGALLERDSAAERIREAYLETTVPTELDVTTVPPKVGAAEVARAKAAFADPAMSGPVVLAVGARRVPVEPERLSPYLSMVPDAANRLQPRLDAARLDKDLDVLLPGVERTPRDARVVLRRGRPAVLPATVGRDVPADRLAAGLLAVLPKTGAARVVPVAVVPRQPELTTGEARALGIREVVSTFTTRYPYAAYRLQNIHRAADLIDGTLVLPGQEFSLNETVGERTGARGFAEGIIISNGRFQKDFGGGVSQVATTTFNAAFFAGLKDVEHKPHSFYISRYPAGREATVAWPSVDLRFLNDSGKGILVDTSYTDSTVTVTLWGTKRYDIESVSGPRRNIRPFTRITDRSEGCVPQEGVVGFDITVTRVFLQNGRVVKREPFHTRYAPAAQITCA